MFSLYFSFTLPKTQTVSYTWADLWFTTTSVLSRLPAADLRCATKDLVCEILTDQLSFSFSLICKQHSQATLLQHHPTTSLPWYASPFRFHWPVPRFLELFPISASQRLVIGVLQKKSQNLLLPVFLFIYALLQRVLGFLGRHYKI